MLSAWTSSASCCKTHGILTQEESSCQMLSSGSVTSWLGPSLHIHTHDMCGNKDRVCSNVDELSASPSLLCGSLSVSLVMPVLLWKETYSLSANSLNTNQINVSSDTKSWSDLCIIFTPTAATHHDGRTVVHLCARRTLLSECLCCKLHGIHSANSDLNPSRLT